MPQRALADVVQPAPDAVLQLLVTQQHCCCQGQLEVLGGIVGILTPWQGRREETVVSKRFRERIRGSAGDSNSSFVPPYTLSTPLPLVPGRAPTSLYYGLDR